MDPMLRLRWNLAGMLARVVLTCVMERVQSLDPVLVRQHRPLPPVKPHWRARLLRHWPKG